MTVKWLAPTGLIALSLVPSIAGAIRVTELTSGAAVTTGNARFFDMPLPVMLHIPGALIFCLLGAFQFSQGFRRRRPGWHRVAGRVLVPCGLVAALSGMWMTLVYDLPARDGDLLGAFRILFGSAMVVFLVLGLVAALRRDFTRHRAWMMRGYAIGLGAGTQAVTGGIAYVFGTPDQLRWALFMGAAWVINLAVAERIIRRGRAKARPGQVLTRSVS
ncbi:MAG: DUF2306 domain-containing protein [Nonomuraea sp.]|nr:DUF2306 domain-containing protein [Nonomuraea sp.]